MKISTSIVLGLCLVELACSSDGTKGEKKPDAAAEGTGGTPSVEKDGGPVMGSGGKSSMLDAVAPQPETSTGISADSCATDLVCVSPTGVYVCENAGPELVPCETKNGCLFGSCLAVSGQGVCVQLCQPPEGLPSSTAIEGVVTEFAAGKGFVGTTETPKEKPLAGVKVCLREPKLNVPCIETDTEGKFSLAGLPPNRNVAVAVPAYVTFEKSGYLSLVRGTGLGNGNQTLSPQTRLYTMAEAEAIATTLGVSLPTTKTGWLGLGALALNFDGTRRLSAFSEGTTKQITVEGVTFTMDPAPGKGPFYADENEGFSPADAALGSTTIAGFGYFFDVPAGSYDVAASHPKLNCGGRLTIQAIPGFLFGYIDALCGKGVK